MTTKTTGIEAEIERRVREEVQREEAARVERIRAQVLEAQQREQAEQERQQRIAELRARIPAELDLAPVEEARAALASALDSYMATCATHDARHRELWGEVSALAHSGSLPAGMTAASNHLGTISADGTDYSKSRVQSTLARVSYEAFRRYYPREGWDIGKPQD